MFSILALDQAKEQTASYLVEWKNAIALLHEEKEANNRAMELLDQMKEKLGNMAAVQYFEKELISTKS
jgi:hypothetical protein